MWYIVYCTISYIVNILQYVLCIMLCDVLCVFYSSEIGLLYTNRCSAAVEKGLNFTLDHTENPPKNHNFEKSVFEC